jgi:hypothetical protein
MNRISPLSVAAGLCLAGLMAMAPAVADVPRYQTATINFSTDVGPGIDQHDYTMSYNPCDGTLQGTGVEAVFGYDESLMCSLAGGVLSCDGEYHANATSGTTYDGYQFTYTAPFDLSGTPTSGTATASGTDYPTEFIVTGMVSSIWRNHGAFVSAQPDKKDAAHSCIGMPINAQKAYVAYYGRPADPSGLSYWATRMDAEGGLLNAIIGAFGYSDEFNRRYDDLTYTELVTKIYQQTLGRDPDPVGLAYYVGELQAGRRTLQSITLDVLNGAVTAPDSTVVSNKLDVAAYYTTKVAAGCPYGTEQDGVDVITVVTALPASVAAAKTAIDAGCEP